MALTTLIDDDDDLPTPEAVVPGLTLVYSQGLARAGEQVALTGRASVALGRDEPLFPAGPLGDPRMSGRHAAIVPGPSARPDGSAGWMLLDRGSRNGTFLNGRRVNEAPLAPGDVVRLGASFVVFGPLPPPRFRLGSDAGSELVGCGRALATVRESVAMVGTSEHTVLLVGESGAGKEVVARELHRLSGRPGPFLAVNCASLRGELLESELFGHVRGAFTGAQRGHDGLFQRADRGTLLLDELAEMEEPAQARLLRVLEARAVRPVGASEEVAVATRVVAATNRDVEAAVRAGRLRADLYARLARWIIAVPSLRERREDLGLLVRHLLAREAPGLDVTPELMAALLEAPWPLNVRGLANVLTTARIAQPGTTRLDLVPRVREALATQASLLGDDGRAARPSEPGAPAATRPTGESTRPDEAAPDAARVEEALRQHAGNLTAAARELGLTRQSLYRLLDRLGLDPTVYRPR